MTRALAQRLPLAMGALAFSTLVLVACGLDVLGIGALHDAGTDANSDGPRIDGGYTPGPPLICTSDGGTSCAAHREAGWSPISFATTRETPCPANFAVLELVTDPVASEACTCACAISPSDPPSCERGTLTGSVGQPLTGCTQAFTYAVDGGCQARASATAEVPERVRFAPLAFHPGSCTTTSTPDRQRMTTTSVRGCVPPPACEEEVCAGRGPEHYDTCITHDGDVACPAPFAKRTLAGTDVTLQCSGCSACENSATCSAPAVHYYNDPQCQGEVGSRVADGTCGPMDTGGANAVASHRRYTATMSTPTCTTTSTPVATVALVDLKTICCALTQ